MQRAKRQPGRLVGLIVGLTMIPLVVILQCCELNTDDMENDAVSLDSKKQAMVEFTYFSGTSVEGGVLLSWGTRTETNSAGFNLFRKRTDEAEFMLINETLIPAKSPEGSIYEYLDEPLKPGSYDFTMEEVDNEGTATPHGGSFTVTVFGDKNTGDEDADENTGDEDADETPDYSDIRDDVGDSAGDCSTIVSSMGRSCSLGMLLFAIFLDS